MKNRSRKSKTNEMLPVIIIVAGVLLLIAALALQIAQSPSPTTAGSDIPEPGVQRVTLADSKEAFDSKTALFLDVRDAQSYAAGHVPGALNIPYGELETRLSELDPNQWIITYCTWPAEQTSARAARLLQEKGFKRVNPIKGGYEAWQQANYPIQQ